MKLILISILLAAVAYEQAFAAGKHWAVVVAGSNGYYNYRHQADTCHAYQILHAHGIPDENIVVMMYDDIAQNPSNPTKGIIINHPNGKDVYAGVPKDYTGKDVTPKNFLNVIQGNKAALEGVGSGKVINSGPDDNIFIFFTDHGAAGLVAFPTGVLYAKDFNTAIKKMHTDNKYKQMVIYIEACESGSMLEGLLPDNINVYGTTASNAVESSYACYYDAKRQTYLGDVYSVVWMEDSDAETIDAESLFKQFTNTKKLTNTSHVMQYGDLKLGAAHFVGEFQGEKPSITKPARNPVNDYYNSLLRRDAVPTEDVRLAVIARRLAISEENSAEKLSLEKELERLINDRATIAKTINEIAAVSLSINRAGIHQTVTQQRLKITQHDCYKSVTQHVAEKCFDLQNEFVLNKLYIMANLCEVGLRDFTVNNAIDVVCKNRLEFEY